MQDAYRRQESIASRCDQKFKDFVSGHYCINDGYVVGSSGRIWGQLGVEKVGTRGKTLYQIEGDELVMYVCTYPCENIRRLPAAKRVISYSSADSRNEIQAVSGEKISKASDYKDQDNSSRSLAGTCSWNGVSEQCSAEWTGKTATVTWTSDGKVTRYDFDAGTVYDSANGRTYKAKSYDFNSGCIATANGETCIYR